MIKKYIFNGVEYASEYAVRQAIFEKDRVAFPAEPEDDKVAFWEGLGVTYIEEAIPLETLKVQKSAQIKQAFLSWRNNGATLVSSLGFKVDSNERANTDVSGLLVAYEDNQDALITFRDADNEFHALTYAQVKTLQKEIIENGNYAYAQKWALDAQVESATNEGDLNAIEVRFVGKDFTQAVAQSV